jgi:diguanylate cyclase (GGDEF)-like protein
MEILSVDIRTVILMLWMGNLIAVALIFIYNRHSQEHKFPITLFLYARLAQTFGWILFWLRSLIPDAYSVLLANSLLFIGWALEALAIASIRQRRRRFEFVYVLAMLLSIPVNIAIYQFESSNLRNGFASLVPLAFFILPAVLLTFEKNASVLQRVVGSLYLTYCAATGFRAVAALTSTDTFTLMTPNVSQTFTFLSLFWLMLFGAIGYLLLFKEKVDQELHLAATIDHLTNIFNRRSLFNNVATVVSFAIRSKEPIALLTIDIDEFKEINNVFGHPMGDLVLKDFASTALQFVRPYDVFGRVGGDEFMILLPKTSANEATVVAERIRDVARKRCIGGKNQLQYTVSIGVCSLIPQTMDDLVKMVQASDDALYGAKTAGRNRVVNVT